MRLPVHKRLRCSAVAPGACLGFVSGVRCHERALLAGRPGLHLCTTRLPPRLRRLGLQLHDGGGGPSPSAARRIWVSSSASLRLRRLRPLRAGGRKSIPTDSNDRCELCALTKPAHAWGAKPASPYALKQPRHVGLRCACSGSWRRLTPPLSSPRCTDAVLNLGQGMTHTLLKAITTNLAEGHQRVGLMLGVLGSVDKGCGVLAPLVGGPAYDRIGPVAPACLTALFALLGCVATPLIRTSSATRAKRE
mmetsp:Transcript_66176/g.147739  ORF Transcript_66176/g.147739 Transcript_66176/m.147739 type:complete len:249 (+) Transcript_66176:360-1106(+)